MFGWLLSLLAASGSIAVIKSARDERWRKKNMSPTETNIPLQEQIEAKVREALSKDMDVIKPEVTNLYDYICGLRTKYGLPPGNIYHNPVWNEAESKACASSESSKTLEWPKFYRSYVPPESLEVIRKKYTIRERLRGVPFYKTYRSIPCFKQEDNECFNACSLSTESHLYHYCLWQDLIRREMKTRGYAMSYETCSAGKVDKDKQLVEKYKNIVMYSWNYSENALKEAKRELWKRGINPDSLPKKPQSIIDFDDKN